VTEPTPEYTASAGTVVFPRSASQLRDTTLCPACFTALRTTVCDTCGLDVAHPAATALAALSHSSAASLDRRAELINEIRVETAQARARAAAPTPASAAPAAAAPTAVGTPQPSAAPVAVAPAPAPSPAQTPPPFPSAAASAAARPQRSSVQILLLVTGVALLSAYGIYAVATGQLGVVALSVVMAAVTASTYVIASVLRRRGLRSTAEGIAVLAVVLTYLCALAARANNLLGFEGPTNTVFWGWALLLTSALFVVWSRLSHLRSPGLIGVTLLSVGAGLLAGGIPTALETPTRVFLGLLTMCAVGLTHTMTERVLLMGTPTITREPERILAIVPAALGGVFAFFTAFLVAPESTVGPLFALLALGIVALLHIGVALRQAVGATPTLRATAVVIATSAAVLATISFGATGFALSFRIDSTIVARFWPAVLATVVVLVADTLHRRVSTAAPASPSEAATRAAFWAAVATTLFCLATPVGVAVTLVARPAVLGGLALADGVPGTVRTVAPEPDALAAIGAFAVITALAALVWTLTRAGFARRLAVGWMTVATVIVAVPLLTTPWLMSLAWFAIAAATLMVFLRAIPQPSARFAVRLLALSTVLVALAAGFLTSWTTASAWWWGSLATIALLLVARRITAPAHGALRAGMFAVATLVTLLSVGSVGRQLGTDAALAAVSPTVSLDTLRFTGACAIILLAVSAAVRTPRFAQLDRRTLFWISFAATAFTTLIPVFGTAGSADAPVLPEPLTGLLLAFGLVAGLLLWIGSRTSAGLLPERLAASIALAPAVSWAIFEFAQVLQLPASADVLTPITAALLVTAGALALSAHRTSTIPRWARETGVALVAVPVVLAAVALPGDYTWLVLLLAALTTLMVAVSDDGLLASSSARRQLGWLALALATAGLWWRLAESDVTGLEPYLLPLTGVLLLLAVLLDRANRARGRTQTGAASYIALAGLLVAILPIGAAAAYGPIARPLIVGLLSSALLFLGTLGTGTAARRPYLDVAAVAGAVGVVVVSLGRAVVMTIQTTGTSGPALDAWVGSGFIVLVIAAFGLTRERTDVPAQLRDKAAQALGAAALSGVLVVEIVNFAATDLGAIRALTMILLFSAVHVIASAVASPPLTAPIGRLALVYAMVAALAGVAIAGLDPLEMVTVPIALAVIASGYLQLERTPSARSWNTVGPGIAMLLAPSLIATAFEQPVWRLVALGVVAITVMVVGAVRRLQAPFVLGAAFTLVHVLATFSDEIRAVYESAHWLLWAAIGGVLLIVLAARYEQRVQNLKSIVLRVTSLR
jgi:hypothetical protein